MKPQEVTYPSISDLTPTWIGLIKLDIFRMAVPLFVSEPARKAVFRTIGVPLDESDNEALYEGCVATGYTPDDTFVMCLYLSPHSILSTWVHEASHIIDLIFERIGIPPGVESTEVRAYALGYVTEQIIEIMADLEEATKKARTKPKRTRKKSS